MNAFETAAVLEDPSHLTLNEPVPGPPTRQCRVIVLFESGDSPRIAWPSSFFEEIRITDPAFMRPAQGEMPSDPAFCSGNPINGFPIYSKSPLCL